MNIRRAEPKDACAVILLRHDSNEVFIARRNPRISFLGGFHAFPGGKVDPQDAEIRVANCADAETEKFIVCAVRETFEEVGVLLVRGAEKITKGQFAALHDDLTSGRFSFAEILQNWGLRIDAEDFFYTGFWTTPEFSPVRFKTRFFAARCPRKQTPKVFGEFVEGEFLKPSEALERRHNAEILIAPPVLITLEHLAQTEVGENAPASIDAALENLRAAAFACDGVIRYIKFHPYITCFPVRTETLPPATHTNCFIVGEKEFVVIDAAAAFVPDCDFLFEYLGALLEKGGTIKELILTHHHPDHYVGVKDLQNRLREKYGVNIPISAHQETAKILRGKIEIEKFIADDEVFDLATNDGENFSLRALHTPGHAAGHLCFYDERRGFLLSGDNVVGAGSVLVSSSDGNMIDYLNSLERMKNLPNLRFLCGAHGPAVYDAKGKIEAFISHRLEREEKILKAIGEGAQTTNEIVEKVYTDVVPALLDLAKKSVEAHLEKLRTEEKIDF